MEFDTSNISMNFDYESAEIEDIKRCLKMLYSTREGEQPLDRNFGLNTDFVGDPIPVAENKFTLEVARKTAKYEPRVIVKEVEFKKDEVSGMLIPRIYLSKGENEE